jgi:pachytene checkpoint protein 2
LVGLDHLGRHPNVLVICTSNLMEAMVKKMGTLSTKILTKFQDPAFLDRIDIKRYIPKPCAKARYELYRTCYLDLSRCGIISRICRVAQKDSNSRNRVLSESEVPMTISSDEDTLNVDEKTLPEYSVLCLRFWNVRESLPWRLWAIAENSFVSDPFAISCQTLMGNQGFSARTLCRLPILALAMHVRKDPCSMDEALTALAKAVQEEKMMGING